MRVQNDPISFMEETSVMPPSVLTLALGAIGTGCGPKVHRMFEPEGNFEKHRVRWCNGRADPDPF